MERSEYRKLIHKYVASSTLYDRDIDATNLLAHEADAQRTLDAAQELSAAWAEKARQYELELEGDPQNLHGQGRTFGLRSQLATLQAQLADRDAMILQMGKQAAVLAKENMAVKAQLRQVEGERAAMKGATNASS